MKVGILAAGMIAHKMAETLVGLNHSEIELYAVASRSLDRAQAFANKYNMPKAYGSYEELAADSDVDLIYIASPHSEHHIHAMMCLKHKKALLVEKAFTANEEMAKEVLSFAKEQQTLVAEAIWTRYMPSRSIISKAIEDGKIGKVHSIMANLGYPVAGLERIIRPELAGGALLDLGVYPINFSMMFFGHDLAQISGTCIKADTGIDLMDSITLTWKDGKIACLHATTCGPSDRNGIIYGDKGYIVVTNINNPEKVEIFNADHQLVEELPLPPQVSGYEHQVVTCLNALKNGQLETPEMTHEEILDVMRVMDKLRADWSLKYPFE